MTRTRIALASLVLLGGLGMLGSPAASAADGVVVYQGSGIASSGGETRDVPVTLTITCVDDACTVEASITADGLTIQLTPGPVAITAGDNTWPIAAGGDPCAETWLAPGSLSIALDGDALSGTRIGDGSGEIECGNGDAIEYFSYVYDFTASLASGDPCTITGACPEETPTPVPTETAAPISAPVEAETGTGAAEPSVLSTLPTTSSAFQGGNIVWAIVGAIVLVILVALPSHLLTNALESASARAVAWVQRVRPVSDRLRRVLTGWPFAAGAVVVAALISSFIDPAFGFTAASIRVFLSILVSFAIDVVLGWFLLIWIVKRLAPGASATFTVAPFVLLVVVAAVVFSRVTGFEPGLVYGAVAGVAFGTAVASARDNARITLIPLGFAFALGLVAWVGYSLLQPGDSAVLVFVHETLAALAIGGLVALPIALVPLPGLAGAEVYRWNRAVWAGCYALGLAGFLLVLMPLPASWDAVPVPLGAWIGVVVAYAVLATGAWLLITRPWVREKDAAPAD